MRTKDIVLIGMMSAILIAVQVGLSFIPNFELVTQLIILFTIFYGFKTLFIVYIFVFAEGLIYGFAEWWFYYTYVWLILFLFAFLFRKRKSPLFWAILSGLFGLSYGALCSILKCFLGGIRIGFAFWISGIPFDLAHGFFNFVIVLVLFHPLSMVLNHLRGRSGHFSNEN